MNILIIEDNELKQQNICNIIDKEYNHKFNIDMVDELEAAKRMIADNSYDLYILDFAIKCEDHIPSIEYGIELYDIIGSKSNIIGYSSGDDIVSSNRSEIIDDIKFIKYTIKGSDWEKQLLSYLNDITKNIDIENYSYDLAIITALQDEFDYVLKASNTEWFINRNHEDDLFDFHTTRIYNSENNKSINVVACTEDRMGMSDAAALSTKLILNFSPKYLCMTGICAGMNGKVEKGNIIVAERFFNYQAVTIKKDKLQPTFYDEPCNPDLLKMIKQTVKAQDYNTEIRNEWDKKYLQDGVSPSAKSFDIIVGKQFGTGSAVVKDGDIMNTIQEDWVKDIIALDMEAYSVMIAAKYAPRDIKTIPFVIKSVQDFADKDKDKTYRSFSAYASAKLLFSFCKDRLINEISKTR